MSQRITRARILVCLSLAVAAALPAQAKYRYGRYATGSEGGLFVRLEAGLANPRNTDAVVATLEAIDDSAGGTNTLSAVIPDWDDEFAGRLGIGYQWANGNKLGVTVWNLSTDQSAFGDGPSSGVLHFAVGPPIASGGQYVGANASPGSFGIETEIEAATADLAWGREQELSESFLLEWSLGLRYASYEETSAGFYDEAELADVTFGENSFAAAKSIEGEMFGARVALRGSYRIGGRVSLQAGLGFSFLDGELTASSSLTATGTVNSQTTPAALASLVDDSRSGTARDMDVALVWHSPTDALRVALGWEQSAWEEIASDPLRNFPGTSAPLRERDSVTFSGYKLGLYIRF